MYTRHVLVADCATDDEYFVKGSSRILAKDPPTVMALAETNVSTKIRNVDRNRRCPCAAGTKNGNVETIERCDFENLVENERSSRGLHSSIHHWSIFPANLQDM
jgi:hypothetical protein